MTENRTGYVQMQDRDHFGRSRQESSAPERREKRGVQHKSISLLEYLSWLQNNINQPILTEVQHFRCEAGVVTFTAMINNYLLH